MQSAFFMAVVLAKWPCMPSMPRKRGVSVGIAEMPMSEQPSGASSASASASISACAPLAIMPPPK